MAKKYIAKALTYLSTRPNGPQLCDNIAEHLSVMTSAGVNEVNDELNFGWLKWAMRNVQIVPGTTRDELADKRRAAMLVARVLGLPPASVQNAESWDEGNYRSVFDAGSHVALPNHPGYYLKGSFWGFSSHSEREWTRESWLEAGQLLNVGIQAIHTARVDHAAATPQSTLLTRYFSRPQLAGVLQNLMQIRNGWRHNTVGITYHANGLAQNSRYQEYGPDVHPAVLTVRPNSSEWGWASPQGGTHNNIGFGDLFFILNETAIRRRVLHSHQTPGVMEVTRGGAIVHELSHRYVRTADVEIPAATFTYLNRPFQAVRKGYGPYSCWALGQSAPDLAVNNADSYRLFCEDALASQ
jgi:hypothetical protein